MQSAAMQLAACCCQLAVCCCLLLPLLPIPAGAADPVCKTQLNSCSCETVSGGKIDLSPLAKTADFAFSGRGPKGGYAYLYNPCNGLACASSSGGAASCQRSIDGKFEYLLGTQATARFDTQPEVGLHVTYTGLSGDGVRRSALVQLLCDSSGGGTDQFKALDDGSTGPQPYVYRMSLKSKHCCEKSSGGGGGGGGGGGLSGGGGLNGGDTLLIVFFCLALVYVSGGIAFSVLSKCET